ncbi:unnamed protein product [Penicillium salamii]|uniref:Anaphase-promoting complex subunit 13 n=1 Tax=Penicillium salamii TaxID=1612424 RepID=A0A9W4NEL0_9EURO|nr:unnamed protein product [Penicillium salamii]CAG8238709.1 unnamed protein product [Penicillium salamii]CAG8359540.1 unnamed protein product [Penicillium salamii]CAG8365746.1 unnamed protein product [Penicillium salamii]CAG8367121.1 unnamed protein product [Penicillium salamii]
MSKDSSASYIHMHQPRLADLFEEFTRPHTSPTDHNDREPQASPTTIPSFLPVEDIYVAPQYQPPNPEDEDDVVPDQHAAFGITRAMDRRREAVWRDLGLESLVNGQGNGDAEATGTASGSGSGSATLRGSGGGPAAAGMPVVRVKAAGRKMGGRRVVGLR